MAYYPVWEQTYLSPEEIDFTAFSILTHFAALPLADGTFDSTSDKALTPAQSKAAVERAHKAGRKILLCVGGWNTHAGFAAAIADPVRGTFIDNLLQLALSRGYDGLDIDFEPLEDQDVANYESFVHQLRARMNAANPTLMLTCAVSWQPALFARLQDDFDQINIMTYDMSGTWQGFSTWFNGPLYGEGEKLMAGAPYPSVQGAVKRFTNAGVRKDKLGIGAAFYGYVWTGASAPEQDIQGVKATDLSYHAIMDQYYQPSLYHWDALAHAPYISIDSPDPAQRKFISYDDERLCAEKVRYAKDQGLGGVIIWEIGDGYRANLPDGRRNPLLQAMKRAWLEKAASLTKPTGKTRGKTN